jgi:hypothetical protein
MFAVLRKYSLRERFIRGAYRHLDNGSCVILPSIILGGRVTYLS